MNRNKMIDLMYMYGADIAQKIDQIVSLEIYGSVEKSHTVEDVELSFYDAVTKNNKYLVKLEDGSYSVIGNHAMLFKLDSHLTNILETVDMVIALEQRGVEIDYNSVVAQIQTQTLNLLKESIDFIKEW